MDISEYLFTGIENAQTSKQLREALNLTSRGISRAVMKGRRAGKPICSSTQGKYRGYYLAADKEEMQAFCNRLHHRAGEIYKTRRACMQMIEGLPDPQQNI